MGQKDKHDRETDWKIDRHLHPWAAFTVEKKSQISLHWQNYLLPISTECHIFIDHYFHDNSNVKVDQEHRDNIVDDGKVSHENEIVWPISCRRFWSEQIVANQHQLQ